MKSLRCLIILFVALTVTSVNLFSQDSAASLLVNLRYFVVNNNYQYITVQTKIKTDKKISPAQDVVIQLYLDSISPETLLQKVRTNEKGDAKSGIPFKFHNQWMAGDTHRFIAVTEATRKSDETVTELEVSRGRITLDTLNADGVRTVSAHVESLTNGIWIPAKDVEVKLGVRRHGGILKINEAESVTTDSVGSAEGEFSLDSLPADHLKNITLVASVEDDDRFGNLLQEKIVPWGIQKAHQNTFEKRSLWATRDKAPVWLMFMAYSIIAAVWGVLIYLVIQLVKIRRLGKIKEGREPVETIVSEMEYSG